MSGFDPDWLALREPYDHRARDAELTAAFVDALGPSPRLIDLGSGSGSNLRFLVPYLPPTQSWLCIDHDPALLRVLEATKPPDVKVETRRLDLATQLDEIPNEPEAGVTAAALLDLTSRAWLDQLSERCHGIPVLMTLSVDGEMAFEPGDSLDEPVCTAFWHHQKIDKGFGPALGQDASRYLEQRLGDLGHDVRSAKSNWAFAAEDTAILAPLLEGIAAAAAEIEPTLPSQAWLDRRLAAIDAGQLALVVGHEDLLALPR